MKKLYFLIALFCCTSLLSLAQNVNLQVVVTKLERTAYVDCIACGDPDPTWKIQGTHNGLGALTYGPYCWHYADMNPTLWDIADYNIMNIVNTNATTFTLGFNDAFEKSCSNNNCTYESYNFFTCFPSVNGDSRRCQNTSLVISNFRTTAPCQWHTQNSAYCGDYRFEYAYYWSFNYAPSLVIQPAPSALLCLGTSTTLTVVAATDINGWNTGVNYQWQISASTACPGTGWTDILGATANIFTPSEIPGTRLYRCKVTSNCTPDFSSNTTISNCSVVTYNPIGSPGDLVPDIVSGICGSTVLPGSVHQLGILTPPNAGAVLGATDYAWTADGGSPLTFNGQNFTWTAPTNPGTYTINLTYIDNCPQPDAQANACVVNVGSATCDFAYVATYGQDSVYRGGPDNPYKTLEYALTQLNGRKYIRMATGVYNETNPLHLQNDLVIEGGYKVNGNIWSKNNSDSTTIIGNGLETISGDVAHRVCFISDANTNWRLQDLVIRTTDVSLTTTNGKGYSNYALLALNNSSGFEIVRCKITSGNSAKGVNGTTPGGAGGAGGAGSGGAGGAGSTQACNGSGANGSGGTVGNGGAAAGGAGSACGGGGCNIFGCNASGCNAGGGSGGGNGAPGAGYAAGVRPLTPAVASPYYIPAGQSPSGSNGFGGGGGGGGGGGDVGSCCTCGCGSGSPNGGSGGSGGGGGLPGSGGFGGGGTFGIFASGGSTGTLTTTLVTAGNFGSGGDGAAGQAGAGGQPGANGVNHGGCDGGVGGNGGAGGAGGNGGRGQDGANGLSQNIATAGGAVITGSSTGVPNTFVVGVNYQNAKACINSEIELTKSSGVWTLPGGMNFVNDMRDNPAGFPISSYNASSSPLLVYVTTPSVTYDLTINGNVYAKYISIATDNRALPTISNSSSIICLDGTDSLTATHWGTEVEYDWRIYQGTNVNSPLYQSSLPSPVINFYGFAAGLYTIRYRVRESCCGWSKPVFDTLRIMPLPVLYNVYGGGYYCPGSTGAIVNLSGSEPGVKYILLYNGNAVDSLIGTGGPLAFAAQTGIGNYTVVAVRFTGCATDMFGTASIGMYPAPQAFNVSGNDTLCIQGANLSATVTLDGSELGTNYQLIRNGIIPVGAPIPGSGLALQFTNITSIGVYTVFASNPTTGCTAAMNDSAVIDYAPPITAANVVGGGAYCFGDSGVVIGLDASEAGTVYQLLQGGVLPSATPILGTGSAINFNRVTVAGYYKVKATSAFGCESWMTDSAWVNVLTLPTITSVSASDVVCAGNSNGVITIGAVSSNGSVSYSIDSASSYSANNVFVGLPVSAYNVFVKDDSGCVARYVVNPVQVKNPITVPLVITSVIVSDLKCAGDSTGTITVHAVTPNGSLFYSVDSALNYSANNVFTSLPAAYYNVVVKDDSGCVARYVGNPVEVASPSELVLSMHGVSPNCFGNRTGSATVVASGGTPGYAYMWNTSPSDVDFTIDNLGGNASYSVTVTDRNNCTAEKSVTLTEPSQVVVNVFPSNVKCFEGNNGSVIISATGGLSPYDYYLNGIYQFDSVYTGLTAGNYLATAQDANHCVGSATFSITQPQAFTVFAGVDIISSHGQTVQLLGTAYSLNGIIGYHWSPNFHIDCDTCAQPMVSPDTTTTYILSAMDGDSCVGYDSVIVYVKHNGPFFIPTAFTPNDDKLNDYFEFNILGAEIVEVRIFNRWGEQQYYNANQHNGIENNGDAWDGKKNGKFMPFDTYTYQLKIHYFDGTDDMISGTVTLMK